MPYYRKIVGERLYLSPFDADDPEIYTKWARWMNDRTVADGFGGYHTLVSPAGAKKTLEELKGCREPAQRPALRPRGQRGSHRLLQKGGLPGIRAAARV